MSCGRSGEGRSWSGPPGGYNPCSGERTPYRLHPLVGDQTRDPRVAWSPIWLGAMRNPPFGLDRISFCKACPDHRAYGDAM
jgi:hypothetical protein